MAGMKSRHALIALALCAVTGCGALPTPPTPPAPVGVARPAPVPVPITQVPIAQVPSAPAPPALLSPVSNAASSFQMADGNSASSGEQLAHLDPRDLAAKTATLIRTARTVNEAAEVEVALDDVHADYQRQINVPNGFSPRAAALRLSVVEHLQTAAGAKRTALENPGTDLGTAQNRNVEIALNQASQVAATYNPSALSEADPGREGDPSSQQSFGAAYNRMRRGEPQR